MYMSRFKINKTLYGLYSLCIYQKTQVYLKENVLVFNLKRLCLPIKT